MKRTIIAPIAAAVLLVSSVSFGQNAIEDRGASLEQVPAGLDAAPPTTTQSATTAAGLTPEDIPDIDLENVPPPSLPPMQSSDFAQRTLTYDEGATLLRENNLDVKIARKSLGDAAIIDSRTKQIFAPSVNLSAHVMYNGRKISLNAGGFDKLLPPGMDVPDMTVQPHWDYAGTLTATQPLFTAQVFPAKKLAKIVKKQAHAGVKVAVQQSILGYNQLYFNAVRMRRAISVAEQNEQNAALLLNQATILFEEKAGPKFDVTRAEVQHRAAQRQLKNAKTNYVLAIHSLATLIRTQPDFDVEIPKEMEAPASAAAVTQAALDSRPALRAQMLAVQRNDKIAETAKMRKYPVIMVQGTASAARKTVFTGKIFNWSVGLLASWDIYDGGAASRDRRSARLDQARAQLELQKKRDSIRDEIQQAWLQYENQMGIVAQAKAEAQFAEKNYELTQDAHKLGSATALEVDVAQTQLFQAQLAYVNAESARMAAIYNLYILKGTSPMVLGE